MSSPKKQSGKKRGKKAGAKRRQETLDLAERLGATKEAAQCFSLYIPDKDRNGKKMKNHSVWVSEAKKLLAWINGGATAMPPTDGVWVNEESGKTIEENTVVVYSFIQPDRFEAHLPEIRAFLHRFGRETNQGEVSCEFSGFFYRILEFDVS